MPGVADRFRILRLLGLELNIAFRYEAGISTVG